MPKICIVITSINKGEVLDDYCVQAESEGIKDHFKIVVIPDRKSPGDLYKKCYSLSSQGFNIECPTLQEQDSFLGKFGNLSELIPYDSDNRRNIGFLLALDWGCDMLISIDDDNYCLREKSTYDNYAIVCKDEISLTAIHSNSGWFNLCEMLETKPAYRVYPRGFPYSKRHQVYEKSYIEEKGLVRLNTGLWIGEPDMDAITWLAAPVYVSAFINKSILLGSKTWSPINTQNTSLHRDLISTYYFIRMGYPAAGIPIDRYGDIFSGYFCQACVRHMGHRIRVGTPIALHKRNSHNYLRDLNYELGCIWMLEDLVDWLHELRLEGSSYYESYLSLAEAIDNQVERFTGFIWTDVIRGYFHQMTYCMRQWVSTCKKIN